MTTRRMAAIAGVAALLAITIALARCSNGPAPDGKSEPPVAANPDAAEGATASDATSTDEAFELTPALLEAYAKGLRKEAEIIRRPGRGTHYGVTISKYGDEAQEVVAAAGLSIDDYRAIQDVVDPVFTTLNFQGKIGPPRSIDVERAPEWKQRLAGDPFDELSPASAKVLREHMDILVPPWSEIIALTAQHG
ncbi:hypothetical protein ACFONC_04580 [Luteimonas soli]|uniref:Uncharacterized protein n=1 Tax=Luteimonas soli TaxID=1648966 RepID=A0ABV7XH22_9GAMM